MPPYVRLSYVRTTSATKPPAPRRLLGGQRGKLVHRLRYTALRPVGTPFVLVR